MALKSKRKTHKSLFIQALTQIEFTITLECDDEHDVTRANVKDKKTLLQYPEYI